MLFRATTERLPLPDRSIDLIFTDPPYPREYLSCYWWLAQEARRVLKPGGFVIAMCGGMYVNSIMKMFEYAGLTFHWQFSHISTGNAPYIWPRRVYAKVKQLLSFSLGPSVPRVGIFDGYTGRKDKRFHHWGQDVDSARYYIDCFSKKDDTILDPFIGGGTTAVACELLSRRWLGCDIDGRALNTTRERMNGADILKQAPLFATEPSP